LPFFPDLVEILEALCLTKMCPRPFDEPLFLFLIHPPYFIFLSCRLVSLRTFSATFKRFGTGSRASGVKNAFRVFLAKFFLVDSCSVSLSKIGGDSRGVFSPQVWKRDLLGELPLSFGPLGWSFPPFPPLLAAVVFEEDLS